MKNITVSRSELYEAYHSMPAMIASAHFGVSIQTFYKLLDQAGIERKRPNFKRGENIKFEVVD